MRSCLILFLAIGCGDDNGNTPVKDMAMPVQKDLTVANADCDVAMQNCATGQKCVGFFDGQNLVGTCVANGTVAPGQACQTQQSMDTLLDNCQGGYICDNLFGNAAEVCRKICATDSDCGSGEKCGDFLFARAGWGWCSTTCTPFNTSAGNCPANMDCGETVDSAEMPDPNVETGFFLCKKTGAGGAYASCMGDSDCGVNLWCGIVDQSTGNAACLPNCSDTVDCPQPPVDAGVAGTVTCFPLASQPDNAGFCLPQ